MNKRLLIALFATLAIVFRGNAQCQINIGIIPPVVCPGQIFCVPYTIDPAGCVTDIRIEISKVNQPSIFPGPIAPVPGNCVEIPTNIQRGTYGVRLRSPSAGITSVVKQFFIDTLDFSPPPSLSIQILPPIRPSYCPDDTIKFQIVNVQNVSPGYTIQWTKNDTSRVDATDTIFTITGLVDNTFIYASITKANRCAQNATGYSDTLRIKVNKKPKIKVILAPGSTGCEKAPNTFIARLDSAGENPFITWFKVAPWGTVPLDSGFNDTTFTLTPSDSAIFGYQICAEVRTERCRLKAKDCFSIKACGEVFLDPPLDATACAGSLLKVPYTILGSFLSTNVFQVQLSDSNGDFTTPISIGALASNIPDTIDVLIPDNLPAGNCYKVRIIASSPPDTSDSSACIKVFPKPPVPQTVNDSVCKQGSVTLLASSIIPGATFQWFTSPFGGTSVFTGNSLTLAISHDTTFYVSQVSGDGCLSDRVPVKGVVNPAPLVEAGADQRVCRGVSSLTLTPFPLGGVWSGDLTVINDVVDITSVPPGVYTLVYSMTSSLGCQGTDTLRIRIVGRPPADGGPDVAICKEALPTQFTGIPADGIWTGNGISVGGLFFPSDPDVTSPINPVYYTVTANGCSRIDTVLVTIKPSPSPFTVTTTNPSVCGAADGTATITGITTGAGFGVHWSVSTGDSLSDPTISSLVAGTYEVTVTDSSTGCYRTVGFAISDPTAQIPVISGLSPAYCSQDAVVTLTATPSGGTFSGPGVSGNQFDPSQAFIGLNSISYSYALGSCTGAASVSVTVNSSPVVNAGGPADTVCSDAGSFALTGFSPIAPPAVWSPLPIVSPVGIVNPGAAIIGNNTLTLTRTLGGCTTSKTRTLFVFEKPAPTITRFPLTTLCQGGVITLTANIQPGIIATRYEWFNGGIIIPNENGSTLQATQAGTYTVKVIGLGTCEGTSNAITIAFNALPVANVTPSGILTPCSNNPTLLCADSLAGYSFQWFGPDSIGGATNRCFTPSVTGQYRVRVRNGLGCVNFSAIVDVTINQAPVVPIVAPPFADTCLQQGQPVTITAGASGSGLSYQWFKVGIPNLLLTGETNPSITLSTPGSYFVQVSSSNGCQTNSSTINLKQTVQISIQDTLIEKCQGEEPFVVSGLSPSGCTLFFNGSPLVGNLFNPANSGDFILTYVCTNSNGCQSRKNITVRVSPRPQAVLTVQGASNVCQGDSVRLIMNDGVSIGCVYQLVRNGVNFGSPVTSPIIFVKTDGTYSVKVTCSGCESTSNSLVIKFKKKPNVNAGLDVTACSPLVTNLSGPGITVGAWSGSSQVTTNGQYTSGTFVGCDTLTLAVDSNGCSNSDTRIVCINPVPDFSTASQNASACLSANGAVWVVNAPVTGYAFEWTKSGNATVLGTTDSLTNLVPGVYQVKISDSLTNCSIIRAAIINSPNNLDITISGLPDSVCSNGAMITLTGIPADSGIFTSLFNRIVQPNQFDPSIPGPLLDTVFYTVQINGCVGTGKKGIKINPLPTLDAGQDTSICYGDIITLHAVQPASVPLIWSGNGVFNDNQFTAPDEFTQSIPVTFGYTVNGCSSTDSKFIFIKPLPNFTISTTDVTVCGGTDGSVSLTILNPTNFSYEWRKLPGQQLLSSPPGPLPVGVYTVKVTNTSTGCSQNESFGINGPTNVVPFACLQNVPLSICQNEPPITLVRCSQFPSSTIFVGGIQTDILNPAAYVAPDNIGVILTDTDANGCIGVEQKVVEIKDFPSVNTAGMTTKTCTNQNPVTLTGFFPATGGTWSALNAPAGFILDPNIPTINPSVVTQDATVQLVFSVTLPNGCSDRDTIDYKVYKTPAASITSNGLPLCNGATGTLSSSTINPEYTYQWFFGSQADPVSIGFGPTLSVSLAGVYRLVVENNGCKSSFSSIVNVDTITAPIIVSIGPDTVLCQGADVFQITPPNLAGNTQGAILTWTAVSPTPEGFISSGGVVNPANGIIGAPGNKVRFTASKGSCSDDAERTIFINPSVNSAISILTSATEICQGDTARLKAVAFETGYSYQWFKNDFAIIGQTDSILKVFETGIYRVKVLINGSDLCSPLSTQSVTIDVKPTPVVTVDLDTFKVCYPGPPFAIGSKTGFSPIDGSAQWSSPALSGLINAPGLVDPSLISTEGSYTLYLKKSIGSCSAIDSIRLVAVAVPSADFTSSATAICDGDTVTLVYSNPNNYPTTWKQGATVLATNVDIFKLVEAGGYTLEVNNKGCLSTSSSSFEVKVKPTFAMPADTQLCKNSGPIQLIVKNSSGGIATWKGPGVDQNGNFNPAIDSLPASGLITIEYKLENDGCSSSKNSTIFINPVPNVVVVSDKDEVEVKAPAVLSASGGVLFEWTPIVSLNQPSGPTVIATPEVTTTYTVTVTTDKGCKGAGSKEIKVDQEFYIYDGFSPNADKKNDVWIVKNIQKYPNAVVKIFNRWGNNVFESEKGYPKPWDGKYDGEDVPPGAYYYYIELGDGLTPKSGSITLVR